jgi:hypothetical protein
MRSIFNMLITVEKIMGRAFSVIVLPKCEIVLAALCNGNLHVAPTQVKLQQGLTLASQMLLLL